jgi:putative amino-acid transport system permease protein
VDALDLDYMAGLVPTLLGYLPVTLAMAAGAMALALALAVLLALVRVGHVPVLDAVARVFISFFRGTPLLVQLFLFYYGLPQVVPALTAINGVTAAVMGSRCTSPPTWPKASAPRSWAWTAASGRPRAPWA